jgi:hypothetical protein
MFEVAAFTYGMLASFVLASISNNQKAQRDHPKLLTMFGWTLMAFSLTLSLLLSGWLAYQIMSGAAIF